MQNVHPVLQDAIRGAIAMLTPSRPITPGEMVTMRMPFPPEDRVLEENPHFGPVVRIVEGVETYEGGEYGHTHKVTLGAEGSRFPGEEGVFDAWATYLWHPERKRWELGAN